MLCKMVDVVNWVSRLHRDNGHGGLPSCETDSVAPQRELEISSVTGQPLPWLKSISGHLDLWENPLNVVKG